MTNHKANLIGAIILAANPPEAVRDVLRKKLARMSIKALKHELESWDHGKTDPYEDDPIHGKRKNL